MADSLKSTSNTKVHGMVSINPDGSNIGAGLDIGSYDYVSMALSGGDTTETYTFKTGGSGGTTVATVTIIYTDSTRNILSSAEKS